MMLMYLLITLNARETSVGVFDGGCVNVCARDPKMFHRPYRIRFSTLCVVFNSPEQQQGGFYVWTKSLGLPFHMAIGSRLTHRLNYSKLAHGRSGDLTGKEQNYWGRLHPSNPPPQAFMPSNTFWQVLF